MFEFGILALRRVAVAGTLDSSAREVEGIGASRASEMAAAGLVTVTSPFANKTTAALAALSANLVPVPPTIDGIAAGLAEAIRRADDLERRVAELRVTWSRGWTESFDASLLGGLGTVLAADENQVR